MHSESSERAEPSGGLRSTALSLSPVRQPADSQMPSPGLCFRSQPRFLLESGPRGCNGHARGHRGGLRPSARATRHANKKTSCTTPSLCSNKCIVQITMYHILMGLSPMSWSPAPRNGIPVLSPAACYTCRRRRYVGWSPRHSPLPRGELVNSPGRDLLPFNCCGV